MIVVGDTPTATPRQDFCGEVMNLLLETSERPGFDHHSYFVIRHSDVALSVGICACEPVVGVQQASKGERVFLSRESMPLG